MSSDPNMSECNTTPIERQAMEADIACVGFGPAMGGFLTTLTHAWNENPADSAFESRVAPGLPLQVLCYERADDIASGVSGVVTSAHGIRESFPELNPADIAMATPVKTEKILYLLDPVGASRRPAVVADGRSNLTRTECDARCARPCFHLPWTPQFLHKGGGLVMSIGQFNQWVGAQLMASGLVQIWPAMPVSEPLFQENAERNGEKVAGVRLTDQGVDKQGLPDAGFVAGMDVRASLTVVGDGPFGAVGQAIDKHFGMPSGHDKREWAMGMKFVIELPEDDHARSRHRVAHLRLSGAGDIWIPLCASRTPGVGRHLCAVVARRPRTHRLSLPAALHSTPGAVASFERRNTAFVGRKVAG